MTQALSVDPRKRTAVSFPLHGDPWPTIAAWAQRHRFLPREPQSPAQRLFQNGSGFWTAPMKTLFTIEGHQVHLQAWVHTPLFSRIMALFLLPQEMGIQSGGFKGAVPRSMARKAVNELLAQVGAAPIP